MFDNIEYDFDEKIIEKYKFAKWDGLENILDIKI